MKTLFQIFVTLLLVLSFNSCDRIKAFKQTIDVEKPVAQVNEEKLFQEEIDAILPPNISDEEKKIYTEDYIKKWSMRKLIYQKAASNINSKQENEIDQLVEDYRRSLIVQLYQRELVEQKVKAPTDEEMQTYYKSHSDQFRLHTELFKGLYMCVPKNAPKLDLLRGYFASFSKYIAEIEKYSYQNAISYEYFDEEWMPMNEFSTHFPQEISLQKGLQEMTDEQYIYFLYVTELRQIGEIMPFDYAKQEIQVMLHEQKSLEFLRKFEEDLYKRSLEKNEIIRN